MRNSRFLPASTLISSSAITELRFPVIYHLDTIAVIRLPSSQKAVVGEMFTFDSGANGVVIRVNETGARLRLSSSEEVNYAVRYSGFVFCEPQSSVLFSPLTEIGTLNAVCRNTGTPREGLVGWTLFRDDVAVASGNDSLQKDVCLLQGGGTWQSGVYTLKVTSFLEPTQPIRRATRLWNLETPAKQIICGQYTDRLGSIYLT